MTAPNIATWLGLHEPGVYFGMIDDEYHADPSLGSSNLKQLAKNPSAYWFDSWMNPRRPGDKDTPATIRGTAVHQLVLYGEEVFDRSYMRGAVHTDDMTSAEKGAATKAANAAAAKLGKTALNADVYDNIAIASAMIAKNPKLSTALRNGINEVSVFWREKITSPTTGTVMEIPLKARFDCLKPRGIGDLKSLANKYDKAFDRACIDAIVNYDYAAQAKHYLDGRALLPALAKDGKVYGHHDAALFKKIVDAKAYAWQFVFWSAEGAPITYSKIISPGNPILEFEATRIQRAKENFVTYMERFGTEQMWLLEEEPSELYMEELPPWYGR